MELRVRLAHAPLLVPLVAVCGGAALAGILDVPPEAIPWLLAWLFWPAAGAVMVDARKGDRTGLVLSVGAFAPSGAWLSGGPQVTAAELVAFSVLSPPVVAVLALLPRTFPAGNTDRRRLFAVAYATLSLVLGLLAGAAFTGRLTPAALYVGTAIVAVAPFGLACLLLADVVPALDLAAARGAAALLALAVPAAAYVAAVALLASTDIPQQEAAGAVLAAVVALALVPAWMYLRRRLIARVYGPARTPGSALRELARRLRDPSDPDAALASVAESVARAFRSPHAAIMTDNALTGSDEHAAVVPLTLGERTLGTLVVAPRRPGERFARGDLVVLDELAPPLALLVEAVDLGHRLASEQRHTVHLLERERERIREDLHDVLGPLLAGLGMHAAAARRAMSSDDALTGHLDKICAGLLDCRDEVRHLVHDLREAPEPVPLGDAVRRLVDDWAAVADDVGPRFEVAIGDVPTGTHIALERVAGEAVTNVVRHSRARWCRLSLHTEGAALVLTVEDDGRGFGRSRPGVGLTSMRRRLAAVGGTLTVADRPGGGTVLTAAAPLVGVRS